jgi:polar amino acid transport system permease protein
MWSGLQSAAAFVFDGDLLSSYGWRLWAGLRITLVVVVISFGLGFVLAFPVCWARMSRNMVVSSLARSYITVFRGTPLLCQLYLVYYGGGEFRPLFTEIGVWWFFRDAYYCCIFAFTLNTAAYQAEILRGAMGSVPAGQREAAKALGLSPLRTARHVILPQAMLVALRPYANELISIIKASALAAIVTLLDLMGQTRFIFARTFDFSVYLYCALIYLAMTEAIRRGVNRIEATLSRHLRSRTEPAMAMTASGGERGRPPALGLRQAATE